MCQNACTKAVKYLGLCSPNPCAHDPRSLPHALRQPDCLTFNTQPSNTYESHRKDFIFVVPPYLIFVIASTGVTTASLSILICTSTRKNKQHLSYELQSGPTLPSP